ncbi:MAG: hypothetical protein ACI9FJ_001366 [Alteromonadaceae bacterium]|jgi:hypothetical protein
MCVSTRLIKRMIIIKQFVPQALKAAAVVGHVLVSINQFEAVYGDAAANGLKVGLTYLVPFMVCMYSAISNTKAAQSRQCAERAKPRIKHMAKYVHRLSH